MNDLQLPVSWPAAPCTWMRCSTRFRQRYLQMEAWARELPENTRLILLRESVKWLFPRAEGHELAPIWLWQVFESSDFEHCFRALKTCSNVAALLAEAAGQNIHAVDRELEEHQLQIIERGAFT